MGDIAWYSRSWKINLFYLSLVNLSFVQKGKQINYEG